MRQQSTKENLFTKWKINIEIEEFLYLESYLNIILEQYEIIKRGDVFWLDEI